MNAARSRAGDPDQLSLDLTGDGDDAPTVHQVGAVYAIRNRLGIGHSRYRLDWVHVHPLNHWHNPGGYVTCALTLLGGIGGAMVGPEHLVPAQYEGQSTWTMRKPAPHLGTHCRWAEQEQQTADRIQAERAGSTP